MADLIGTKIERKEYPKDKVEYIGKFLEEKNKK